MSSTLLIVDDEAGIMASFFEEAVRGLSGFQVVTATGVEEALAICRQSPAINVVLLDLCFNGDAEGMDVLPQMRALLPAAEIIVFTQVQNPPMIPAMKRGATTLLSKHDYGPTELMEKIKEALGRIDRRKNLRQEAVKLGAEVGAVFVSEAMISVFSEAFEARSQTANVLITGPTGAGKELVAKAIGEVPGKPYVAHSCANIEDTLIESKLFGHERGAFTDAKERHIGLFEQAAGGTLFLDEVGTLSKRVQEALLRVLETGEFMRVGGKALIKVDVRVITATNEDLKGRIATGAFREDLYQRLARRHIVVPSLGKRREDIAPLIKNFLLRHAKTGMRIDPGCVALLERQSWPRNVRQLLDTIDYMINHSGGFNLDSSDVPFSMLDADFEDENDRNLVEHTSDNKHFIFKAPWDEELGAVVKDFEKAYIQATRRRLGGKASARQLALTLKTPESTVRRHLKDHGMPNLALLFSQDSSESKPTRSRVDPAYPVQD